MSPHASIRHVLTPIVILLCGASVVFGLGHVIKSGGTKRFDESIVVSLRNPADLSDPLGPRWQEELLRDVTALGGVGVLVSLTAAGAVFLWLERRKNSALLLVVAIVGGFLFSSLLKSGFDRPRPSLVPHGTHVYSKSFPSGHAMMAATAYLTLGTMIARTSGTRLVRIYVVTLAVMLTAAIGLSRIYLGVHYPTDVLAGWAGGSAWALSCCSASRWLEMRRDRRD